MSNPPDEFVVKPEPRNENLTARVSGIDQQGNAVETRVVHERALTLFLNSQEIVTMMTIGDHPELLALGYLVNQNMLLRDTKVTDIDYDEDLQVVVVRTEQETDFEEKMKKKENINQGNNENTMKNKTKKEKQKKKKKTKSIQIFF